MAESAPLLPEPPRAFTVAGSLCCVAIALFVAGTTLFGRFPNEAQYGITLTLGLIAAFLLKPGPLVRDGRVTRSDMLLTLLFVAGALAAGGYYLANYHAIAAFREGIPNDWDLACYAVGTICVLEGARRVEGWILIAVVLLALAYLAFGHLMPGILEHRPTPPEMVLEVAYSYQGIFGIALGAVVDVVLVFVILGAAFRLSGAGDFFNFIALRLTRGRRSGPAQCAIVASALFGSVNGSAPANVSSTGVLTIPLMRRAGYTARFAGGIEATASCVGQIMPPIMGVGAFIMSEITGVPYLTIVLVAIVPAALFILSLSIAAVLEAGRLGITAPEDDTEAWTSLRRAQAATLAAGFGTLLAMLFLGYSPTYAGLAGAGATLALALLLPPTRFGVRGAATFLVDGGRDGLSVMLSCAAIGIVVGAVTSTGLGVKLNQMIVALGEGHLLAALLVAALCSVILGMGLPTAASYLMVVFVAGPSLMDLGLDILTTHFFVFYYAVLSAITPPVALAVFAAAAISREQPVPIAMASLRLCAVGFALPLLWIYHPEILLYQATLADLPAALAMVTLLCGAILAFNAGHVGYFMGRLGMAERGVLMAGAAAAIHPDLRIQAAAALVLAATFGRRFLMQRRRQTA